MVSKQRHDDPELIPDSHHVVRYVLQMHVRGSDGEMRASSAAFTQSTIESGGSDPSMSCDHLESMQSAGLANNCRYDPSKHAGAIALSVGKLRQLGCLVGHDPLDDNEHHVGVWFPKDVGKKSMQKKISKIASWVKEPEHFEQTG